MSRKLTKTLNPLESCKKMHAKKVFNEKVMGNWMFVFNYRV
jgi:hypothetical protein